MQWVQRVMYVAIKRLGRESDLSPLSNTEVKMRGIIPAFVVYASWCEQKIEGKGTVHTTTGHEGPEGE